MNNTEMFKAINKGVNNMKFLAVDCATLWH